MKLKRFRVVRPEIEYIYNGSILRRFIFPFFCLYVYLRFVRVNKVHIQILGHNIETIKLLVVPKITGADI